ncbi:MAG: S-layer homology domain-containing protein [Phormidesmis sp.]
MTQSPNDPRRDDQQPPTTGPLRPLSFDEMVALFVAFLSLSGVLFWGLTRGNLNLFGESSPLAIAPIPTEAAPGGIGSVAGVAGAERVGLDDGLDAASATAITGDEELSSRRSAVDQLSDRAAARRQRLARRAPIWEDVRDGMVGTAAGVAGVTAATRGADATADTTLGETETAAAGTSTQVPDIGTAIPSEAAISAPQDVIVFNDVPDGYWAEPYIDALSSRGLIAGYDDGTFRPDQPVTRAQIANVVSKTFDLTVDKETLEFSDVASDYWARESIGETVQGGFMTGFPDDTFRPNEPVTRTQTFTTLVTGLGIAAPTNIQATLDRYADANAIPKWANEKIAAATAGSLVVDYPNVTNLNPNEPTTRAELSAIIYQALVGEGVLAPLDSEYLVKP